MTIAYLDPSSAFALAAWPLFVAALFALVVLALGVYFLMRHSAKAANANHPRELAIKESDSETRQLSDR